MNTQHMDDLNRIANKLTKDKIEKVTPVPLSPYEKWLLEAAHVISLPTITEIYCELGLKLLEYVFYIVCFLYFWHLFSLLMDIIFA